MSASPEAPERVDGDRPRPGPGRRAERRREPLTGRLPGHTIDVSRIANNLPFVLRTVFGISALAIGANVIGVVLITAVVLVTNSTVSAGHRLHVVIIAAGVTFGCSVIVGTSVTSFIQRRTLRWLLRGDRPTMAEARRALGMPRDLAFLTAGLWFVGALVMSSVAVVTGVANSSIVAITGGIVLAGLSSAGVTYLLVGRVAHPVQVIALASCPPQSAPMLGVRWRLLLIWVLTSGLPVLGLLLVLSVPTARRHVVGVSIVVGIIALVVGASSTALSARAIGTPLRGLATAFGRVADGDLDAEVPVDDAGEIGLVQHGFNDMVAGLRERDRVKDLFGRHVGPAVAQEALRSGVTLSGETRDVVAVFVDITGSTRMARETDPVEFVDRLNRFFEIVVEEVEDAGGLLNKFEGDAALCVFGAPVELEDPASAALRAGRRIRDRVQDSAEVEVGVGVAAGPVVAGQVGTPSRLEFTVIGDAVNEAARLTDLAKKTDGHLLASGAVIGQVRGDERDAWSRTGETTLRGRDEPTELWTA